MVKKIKKSVKKYFKVKTPVLIRPRGHHVLLIISFALLINGFAGIYSAIPRHVSAATSPYSFVYDAKSGTNYEVYLYDKNGTAQPLTNNASYDSWWARISPDSNQILFYRTPTGTHDTDYSKTSLWIMNGDGSNQHQVIANGANGWQVHGHAEWSPDGNKLLMFAGTNGSLIVTTDTSGNNIQLITTTGQYENTDPSWSPDGNRVVYAYQGEIWQVSAVSNGSAPTKLTNDSLTDYDPYFSPDGTKIAFLTQTSTNPGPSGSWGIRIMNADGSGLTTIIDDGNINSKPEWTNDGMALYFHRLVYNSSTTGFSIWSSKSDGTVLTSISSLPAWAEYPDTISRIPSTEVSVAAIEGNQPVTTPTAGSQTTEPQHLASLNVPPPIDQVKNTVSSSNSTVRHKRQSNIKVAMTTIFLGTVAFAVGVVLRVRHRKYGKYL